MDHPSGSSFAVTLDALEELQRRSALNDFYNLLDTYTLDKWAKMSWPLSPIACALRGWECWQPGTVRCSVCKRSCTFDLFSYHEIFGGTAKTDQTMRSWLVTEFVTKLSEPGHDEKCTRRPLLRASLVNQFANFTMRSFRELFAGRLESLLPVGEKLPVVVPEYDEVVTAKDALACISNFSDLTDATLATNSIAIALHGWEHIVNDEGVNCLACRECRRQVDYSKFCTVDRLSVLQQNETANFHPDMFSSPNPDGFRFDCRREHLSWCPWIRPVRVSPEMSAVLSLTIGPEEIHGCDVTIAAFSVELSAGSSMPGDMASNFDAEAESFRQTLQSARKELEELRKPLQHSRYLNQ
ncbi:hypothetical protein BV898_19163 [Hypsibius exemplaris]|uniref:Nuclear-interacting partner of ALK n=1 Tax=Hypsibius exemplaris TaxID=2072580 RepID=A0A9X6NJ21_HYPEX|nr:hypothetical protein BV898_19163 [Hypsibius exemplaris]